MIRKWPASCNPHRAPNHSTQTPALRCLLIACLCAGVRVFGAETAATPAPTPENGKFTGRLRADYDYRTQGDAKDSDLYGYWYGEYSQLFNNRLDLYSSARLHSDLDSDSNSSFADNYFLSVEDNDDVTETRILQLHLDVHDANDKARLRLGRQYVDIADYIHIDGGQVMLFEQGKLGGRAYFGTPVRFYAEDTDDSAGGLSVVGRPWEGNRSRATIAFYDDGDAASDNDLFLDFQQDITENSRTRAQASILNGDFRMARLDCYFNAEDGLTDLALGGSHWGEFDAETLQYSPIYGILGEQSPYSQLYARLNRNLSQSFLVSPGASFRFVDDSEGVANSGYSDYDLTFIYEPDRSFNTSLSVEYWDTEEGDDFMSLGGELRYRYQKIWEISSGADYIEYTYDTYSDISYSINGGQTFFSGDGTVIRRTPDAYTYFLRARWNVTPTLVLRLQGEIEDAKDESDLGLRGRGSIEVRF